MSEESSYKRDLAAGRRVIEGGVKPIVKGHEELKDPLPPSLSQEEEEKHRQEIGKKLIEEPNVPESPLKREDRPVVSDPNEKFRKAKR